MEPSTVKGLSTSGRIVTGAPAERRHPGRGRHLLTWRLEWIILAPLLTVLTAIALHAVYLRRQTPAPAVRAGLTDLGISSSAYAAYITALLAIFTLVCFTVAAVVARRRSDDGMALFVSILLLGLGTINAPMIDAVIARYPTLGTAGRIANGLLWTALVLFFLLFPDGRFHPRWMRGLALAWIAGDAVALLFDPSPTSPESAAVGLLILTGFGTGAVVQVYRYLRVSNAVQRQQTKWIVSGVVAAIVIQLAFIFSEGISPSFTRPGTGALLYDLASFTGVTVSSALIPLSLGLAVLRYRLWDIDLVLNRALVYGALTASVILTYILVVGGAGTLLQARGNPILAISATGLIAVLFQPLRDRLQRGANHLLYGERDEPYAALSRLGRELATAGAAEKMLPAVVTGVAEALKLPYAAIDLGEGHPTVAVGSPVSDVLRLPLSHGGEPVGALIVGPRAPGETFGAADRRLLDDLARQAGAAAHAVRLTADLRRSRERLVTAREEERRRLRRDLHDGLGPTLAAQTLNVGSARILLQTDPAAADAILARLEGELETALAGIRRLVYQLRPPALDDLGLVAAIRETATNLTPTSATVSDRAPRIVVRAPDTLPTLPAAVEVAAFRIVQEALTNVVRHAQARTCTVHLALDGETLRIEVDDDGRGIPPTRRAGVGLASMRERAAELDGDCVVDAAPGGGTRVVAHLPLPPPAVEEDPVPSRGPAAPRRPPTTPTTPSRPMS